MKFHVLTLFPEIVQSFFETSIMAKAVQKGIIAYELVNIRDFAFDKHKTCDDTPYGGGANADDARSPRRGFGIGVG